MGLDSVELVMEVEKTFEISIDVREAERLVSVGGLYRYLMDRIEAKQPTAVRCKTAVVFYQLRRALIDVPGIERDRVRPSTTIEELIPANIRRLTWRLLQQSIGLTMPGLARPEWVWINMVWASLTAFPALLTLGAFAHHPGIATAAGWWLLASVLIAILVARLTRPLAVCLPADCHSVRGLVKRLTYENYGRIPTGDGHCNAAEVWEVLCSLISTQLGVKVDELTEDTHFVDDLGMD